MYEIRHINRSHIFELAVKDQLYRQGRSSLTHLELNLSKTRSSKVKSKPCGVYVLWNKIEQMLIKEQVELNV